MTEFRTASSALGFGCAQMGQYFRATDISGFDANDGQGLMLALARACEVHGLPPPDDNDRKRMARLRDEFVQEWKEKQQSDDNEDVMGTLPLISFSKGAQMVANVILARGCTNVANQIIHDANSLIV